MSARTCKKTRRVGSGSWLVAVDAQTMSFTAQCATSYNGSRTDCQLSNMAGWLGVSVSKCGVGDVCFDGLARNELVDSVHQAFATKPL